MLATLDASLPRKRNWLSKSPSLPQPRRALDEIKTSIEQAKLDLERTKNLAERELASQAELDRTRIGLEGLEARLRFAERQLEVARRAVDVQHLLVEDMEIRAPFAGVVIAKAAQPGEMISPISAGGGFTRTGICTIVDMDSLEVEVDVNEAYINRVRPGQPVTATLNAYPDLDIPGGGHRDDSRGGPQQGDRSGAHRFQITRLARRAGHGRQGGLPRRRSRSRQGGSASPRCGDASDGAGRRRRRRATSGWSLPIPPKARAGLGGAAQRRRGSAAKGLAHTNHRWDSAGGAKESLGPFSWAVEGQLRDGLPVNVAN